MPTDPPSLPLTNPWGRTPPAIALRLRPRRPAIPAIRASTYQDGAYQDGALHILSASLVPPPRRMAEPPPRPESQPEPNGVIAAEPERPSPLAAQEPRRPAPRHGLLIAGAAALALAGVASAALLGLRAAPAQLAPPPVRVRIAAAVNAPIAPPPSVVEAPASPARRGRPRRTPQRTEPAPPALLVVETAPLATPSLTVHSPSPPPDPEAAMASVKR